jgi:hypothetical protein
MKLLGNLELKNTSSGLPKENIGIDNNGLVTSGLSSVILSLAGDPTDTTTFPTTQTLVSSWVVESINSEAYSYSGGVITIKPILDDKNIRVDWMLSTSGSTNRVELECGLYVNSVLKRAAADYMARNQTVDKGTVNGFWVGKVSGGTTIELYTIAAGAVHARVPIGCSLLITSVI